MTTVYLVRHGTTDGNVKNLFQGRTDYPLNDQGLLQGKYLAERFSTVPLDAVYCSPLTRTRQTADFVCSGVNAHLTPILWEGIIELDGGMLENRPQEELRGEYAQIMDDLIRCPAKFAAPGGESSRQVWDRFRDAVRDIVAENPDRTIAVVSHGFAMITYLNYIQGIPFDEMKRYLMGNMAVTTVTFEDPDHPVLVEMDDQSHVPEELRFRRVHDPREIRP